MDVKGYIVLCMVLALPACATTPAATQSADKSNGLSARTLTAGDCGLFVWTGDSQKRFVLFSQSQNGSAAWLSPERRTQITPR